MSNILIYNIDDDINIDRYYNKFIYGSVFHIDDYCVNNYYNHLGNRCIEGKFHKCIYNDKSKNIHDKSKFHPDKYFILEDYYDMNNNRHLVGKFVKQLNQNEIEKYKEEYCKIKELEDNDKMNYYYPERDAVGAELFDTINELNEFKQRELNKQNNITEEYKNKL